MSIVNVRLTDRTDISMLSLLYLIANWIMKDALSYSSYDWPQDAYVALDFVYSDVCPLTY